VLSVLFGVFTAIAVCLLIVNNVVLALLLFAGFVGTSLVFALLFWGLLKALAYLGKGKKVQAPISRFFKACPNVQAPWCCRE